MSVVTTKRARFLRRGDRIRGRYGIEKIITNRPEAPPAVVTSLFVEETRYTDQKVSYITYWAGKDAEVEMA